MEIVVFVILDSNTKDPYRKGYFVDKDSLSLMIEQDLDAALRANHVLSRKVDSLKKQVDNLALTLELVTKTTELNVLLRCELSSSDAAHALIQFFTRRIGIIDMGVILATDRNDGGTDFKVGPCLFHKFSPLGLRGVMRTIAERMCPYIEIADENRLSSAMKIEELAAQIEDRKEFTKFDEVVVMPCVSNGWYLAVLVLFKPKRKRFTAKETELVRRSSRIFARNLQRTSWFENRQISRKKKEE